ncbi:MAG: helix-turn-helix domain-containing protein [Haloferacaceae archaeon]
MSSQLLPPMENSRRPTPDDVAADPSAVLTALNDTDCRRILEATAAEALTASELAEACDLPLSTTYRKVDLLTDAGLLSERVRLRTSGKHPSEYRRSFDDVVVRLEDAGVEVDLVASQDDLGSSAEKAEAAMSW